MSTRCIGVAACSIYVLCVLLEMHSLTKIGNQFRL